MAFFKEYDHPMSYEHDWNPANSLAPSSGTTTRDFMCFFLFWLLSLPLIWFPVHKMFVERSQCGRSWLTYSGKSSLLCVEDGRHAYCRDGLPHMVHRQGARNRSDRTPTRLHPWIQSGLGHGCEPHVLHQQLGNAPHVRTLRSLLSLHLTLFPNRNAPDFASRARTPAAALWPQLFAFPLASSIVCLIGILVSSSSQAIYGEAIWSPVDLLGRFLDNEPSPATRFGVCLVLVTFTVIAHRSARYGSSPPRLLSRR